MGGVLRGHRIFSEFFPREWRSIQPKKGPEVILGESCEIINSLGERVIKKVKSGIYYVRGQIGLTLTVFQTEADL